MRNLGWSRDGREDSGDKGVFKQALAWSSQVWEIKKRKESIER